MTKLLVDYSWNAGSRQYVDASGKFVARSKVKAALDVVIDAAARDIEDIAGRLQSGQIDIGEWYRETAARIKTINVASAALAVGGTHGLTPSVLGSTAARIKRQYQFLSQFAYELENGLPLDGTFLSRAASYGHSGRPTYEAIVRKRDIAAGDESERRRLHPGEHCRGCVEEAAKGWQPAGVLKDIGDCECLNFCNCTFERSRSGQAAFSIAEADEPGGHSMTTPAVDYVEREGKVFEFGDYPDKQFSLTADEFRAANPDGGAGAFVDLEHFRKPHALLGKLGSVVGTEVKGNALFARVRFPRALDDLLGSDERKVSCHFGPDKRLKQLDLVLNPRIRDAALFSEAADPSRPPEADPGPSTAMPAVVFAAPIMASAPQSNLMAMFAQDFHDIAASCYPGLCGGGATFAANEGPRKHMALIHKKAMNHGASCSGTSGRFSEETEMSETTKPEAPAVATFSADDLAALKKQLASLKAENDEIRRAAILKDAAVFAENEIRADRATVPERPLLVKGYVRAALDDASHPDDATFSVGDVTFSAPRLADFIALQAARPKASPIRTLNKPVAAPASPDGMTVFSNDPADDDPKVPTASRQAELLKLAGLKN